MAVSKLASTVVAPLRASQHRGEMKNRVRWLVIHTAEAPLTASSAEGVARDCASGADGRKVSWHYSPDRDSVACSLNEVYAGRHTGSKTVDERSIAIEMAAYSAGVWSSLAYKDLLKVTAQLAADICFRYSIPVRKLTDSQLAAAKSGTYVEGIISHAQSAKIMGGSTHTDPGPNFPWPEFLSLVTAANPGGPVPKPDTKVDRSMLKLGDSGEPVRNLQIFYNAVRIKAIIEDGDFGPATEAAVKDLQKYYNLDQDGIYGPKTRFRALWQRDKILGVKSL